MRYDAGVSVARRLPATDRIVELTMLFDSPARSCPIRA
jgi:hypothetical protein